VEYGKTLQIQSLWNASCCVSVSYIELYFRQTQQYTNELSHVAKLYNFTSKLKYVRCMREFIGILLCLTEIKLNIFTDTDTDVSDMGVQ
jgi:hypothetical protein